MHIKLYFVKKGEFCKEMELPDGIDLPHRITLDMYGPIPELTGKWVFLKISNTEYAFNHVERSRL